MKRPLSVTIVSWLIIIFALVSTIPMIKILSHSVATSAATTNLHHSIYLALAINAINIIAAIAAIMHQSWGRWVFTIVFVLAWIHTFITASFSAFMLIPLVINLVFIIIYFLPSSNQYYSSQANSTQE